MSSPVMLNRKGIEIKIIDSRIILTVTDIFNKIGHEETMTSVTVISSPVKLRPRHEETVVPSLLSQYLRWPELENQEFLWRWSILL